MGKGLLYYWGFMGLQLVLAAVMPGVAVKGLPVPEEKDKQHTYYCNALGCWYFTLALAAGLHLSRVLPLTFLADNYGAVLVASMLSGNLVAVAVYCWGLAAGPLRMSGSVPYDFFMGSTLNPRLGPVDLKMFAEIRASWLQLFLLTCSAAASQHARHGSVSNSMWLMVAAHLLYANACMKGEECVPTTWDIFHEKFGWMLIFWNLSGVPFVYCFNSLYLLKNPQVSL